MRFILYTDKFYDVGPIKMQTHIQFINKLKKVPDWLKDKPRPVLVDTSIMEAWAGDSALVFFQKKKFVVEDDD